MLSKRATFKDDEVVIAITSFAVEGVDDVIRKGTELRGKHPAVKKAPQFFVTSDTPTSEWPNELEPLYEQSVRREQEWRAEEARKYPQLDLKDGVVCIQGFSTGHGSRMVSAGAVLPRDHELVKKYPQFFAERPRPLVSGNR